MFHTLAMISNKYKRTLNSVGTAEIFAAGYTSDEGNMLRLVLSTLLPVQIDFFLIVDLRDLFNALLSCCNATSRSICADFNVIFYAFEYRYVSSIMWAPGKILADPWTKLNSPLIDTLQLHFASGKLSLGCSCF